MKTLTEHARLRQEIDLAEQASRVLEESKQLIEERRRARAARIEQLLIREDKIARELRGTNP